MVSEEFRSLIRAEGARLYRDLPWRRTRDPYHIWLSEVMLQQTQVARVETRMPAWLERFPSVEALAEAPTSDVLEAWQGMGYNRRALALKRAAQEIMERYDGAFPRETKELVALPGIGPATAQGIRAFAFDLPGVYLETNVRTVFLHHFFPDVPAVPDRELTPLVEATCPLAPEGIAARTDGASGAERFAVPQDAEDTPRSWYYALLDARDAEPAGLTLQDVVRELDHFEAKAGRGPVDSGLAASILDALEQEGFCSAVERDGERVWMIA